MCGFALHCKLENVSRETFSASKETQWGECNMLAGQDLSLCALEKPESMQSGIFCPSRSFVAHKATKLVHRLQRWVSLQLLKALCESPRIFLKGGCGENVSRETFRGTKEQKASVESVARHAAALCDKLPLCVSYGARLSCRCALCGARHAIALCAVCWAGS